MCVNLVNNIIIFITISFYHFSFLSIEEELDHLVEEGTLEPVEYSDWAGHFLRLQSMVGDRSPSPATF